MLDQVQFTWIHGPDIPGSYAISFFTVSDFIFTTRHIHNLASFPLWPSRFILSGAISNCPPPFPSSILDTSDLGGGACSSFYTVHELLQARTLEWFAIPSSSGPRFIRTLHRDCLPLVALHGITHSFTELRKSLPHNKAVIHEEVPNSFSSVQFSHSVISNSLRPHESQHAFNS